MPIEQKHYTLLLSVQWIYDYLLLRIIRIALCAEIFHPGTWKNKTRFSWNHFYSPKIFICFYIQKFGLRDHNEWSLNNLVTGISFTMHCYRAWQHLNIFLPSLFYILAYPLTRLNKLISLHLSRHSPTAEQQQQFRWKLQANKRRPTYDREINILWNLSLTHSNFFLHFFSYYYFF